MEAPVLLIRGRSLFPGSLLRLSVARQRSIALVDERLAGGGAHGGGAHGGGAQSGGAQSAQSHTGSTASLGPHSTMLAIMTEDYGEGGENQYDSPGLDEDDSHGVVSSREVMGGRRPLRIHRFGCGARVVRIDRGTPAQGFAYVWIGGGGGTALTFANTAHGTNHSMRTAPHQHHPRRISTTRATRTTRDAPPRGHRCTHHVGVHYQQAQRSLSSTTSTPPLPPRPHHSHLDPTCRYSVLVQGTCRLRVENIIRTEPYILVTPCAPATAL